MSNIVPFGKYKGQPIEVLQSDPQYVEWLMQQDWVRQRYPSVVNIIINNFGEPDETPEHNRIQMRFLEEEFRLKLVAAIARRLSWHKLPENMYAIEESEVVSGAPVFEVNAVDCRFAGGVSICSMYSTDQKCHAHLASAGLPKIDPQYKEGSVAAQMLAAMPIKPGTLNTQLEPETNCRSCRDLNYRGKIGFHRSFAIEIKPIIGDDYPAVLRQILSVRLENPCRVVLYENMSSAVATESQICQFFNCSGVIALSVDEVEGSDHVAILQEIRTAVGLEGQSI